MHQPVKMVLGIIKKLNDKRREIEKEQAADEKRNIEKEKAERVVAEKKQEELRLRKRKKSLNHPLNHLFLNFLNLLFPKTSKIKRREAPNHPPSHLHPRERRLINHPLHHNLLNRDMKFQGKYVTSTSSKIDFFLPYVFIS